MTSGETSRIVFKADEGEAKLLEKVADDLKLSKIKTLSLAVKTLYRLTKEMSSGKRFLLKHKDGSEMELWLPHLPELPEEDEAKRSRPTRHKRAVHKSS